LDSGGWSSSSSCGRLGGYFDAALSAGPHLRWPLVEEIGGNVSAEEKFFRCPKCGELGGDRRDAVVFLCQNCGGPVKRTSLVGGHDGIHGVKPEPPPEGWSGRFEAVFPDGTRSELDLNGRVLRPKDPLPGTDFVLEQWKVSDEPLAKGLFGVVGILRRK
jgi:predicted RNA-binding Zn-ribbon protein involved in translation (DUF1610 family)